MALKLLYLSTICVVCFCLALVAEAQKLGFSVELIHRDSPKSPFYNPTETHYERTQKTLRSSSINAIHPDSVQSDITLSPPYSYVMNISIGTPPTPIVAVADTGSDIIWTQCDPCEDCFNQTYPRFQPASSSSYEDVPCSTNLCSSVPHNFCNNSCQYIITYGDRSYSTGNIAVETVTLASTDNTPVSFPKIVFGCGQKNSKNFNPGMSGIIGLGLGDVSLVSQLESSIDGKFSYCLIPHGSSASSKLNFGRAGVVSGDGVVTTPMFIRNSKSFYYLTIESFTVGDNEIPFGGDASSGNIIIDSGTTLTLLPPDVASQVQEAIAQGIGAERITNPIGGFDYCFDGTSELKVPDVTVNFVGAKVKLEVIHLLVAPSKNIVCLTIQEASELPIFGNLHQQNYLIGYDINARTVSFKPTDCTQQ